MKKMFTLIAILMLFKLQSFAQSYEIKKVNNELLELKQCPIDPLTKMYALFDISRISIQNKSESIEYTDSNCELRLHFFEITYNRELRFKFTDGDKDDQNVVSFLVDSSNKLQTFNGTLYFMDNNKMVKQSIKRKELTEESDNHGNIIYALKFADLKPGSIIDIGYTIKYSDFDVLPDWKLTANLPILYGEISYVIPEFLVYDKKIALDKNITKEVTSKESRTTVDYRGNDIVFKKYTYQAITEKYSVKNIFVASEDNFPTQFKYTLTSKNLNSVPFDKSVWTKVN